VKTAKRAPGAGGDRGRRPGGAAAQWVALAAGLFAVGALLAGSGWSGEETPPGDRPKEPPQETPREPDKPADGGTLERRIVGSIVFPERGNQERVSSAQKIMTPEVREMIAKALQYVQKSKQADGCWGDKQFPKSSGVTALACMAFMAEGSLPRVGPYGKDLDDGIAFLLSCERKDNGLIVAANTYQMGPMYDHAWSTFALIQAYGNCPWYPDMRAKISRSVQVILKAQKPDGGWRYDTTPMGRSDCLVTTSVLYTIRLAKMAGFAVPEESIAKARAFIERCGTPTRPDEEGTFSYKEGGERGSPSVTGAGLMALFTQGQYNHKYVKPCTERMAEAYRRAHVEELTDSPQFRYFHFGCFYSSQAMYVAGDDYWLPWYKKYAEALKRQQAADGSWQDIYGNTVYPTAISAMVLLAPMGYIPQYLR
jgi:hypothetical protein